MLGSSLGTFIGGESRIVSRQTDLRGICETGGLSGSVNIVAEHEGLAQDL